MTDMTNTTDLLFVDDQWTPAEAAFYTERMSRLLDEALRDWRDSIDMGQPDMEAWERVTHYQAELGIDDLR